MKITNENINEYFKIETPHRTITSHNVLIRPKGYPPINTPIPITYFRMKFPDTGAVKLTVEYGQVCFATDDNTIYTDIPVIILENLIS